MSLPDEIEEQKGQVADSGSNCHNIPIILCEFVLDVISICWLNQICGEWFGISIHAVSQPVDVNCDSLNQETKEKEPSHSSAELDVEVDSQAELFQLSGVLEGVDGFLDYLNCT